jgi:hypothetical protein
MKEKDIHFEIYRYAARVTKMAKILENKEVDLDKYKEWAQEGMSNLEDIKEWIRKTASYLKEKDLIKKE